MHYKDGTPAVLGDIIQHDNGSVGILIGGTIGSDFCSTQAIMLKGPKHLAATGAGASPSFTGILRDSAGKVVDTSTVVVVAESYVQTREFIKIGHVDLGI